MLGWSLTVRHEGETVHHVDYSDDLKLSQRIAEVADEVVDMSHLYEHVDPSYKVWWPGCGYPDVYKVRNDQLQTVVTDSEKLRTLPEDVILDVELWDQS